MSVDDEIIDRPVQASNLPRQTLLSDTSDYRPTESNTDSEVTVSAHAIEHGSGHVLGDQRGHSLNERKVQEDLPSDQPKVVNTGEFASLDVDLNSARNKRRRLSDPEEHHLTSERQSVGWLAQLQEAAYGQPARLTFSQPDLTGGLSKPELDVTTGSLSGTETQDLKKTEDTITDPSVPAAEAVSPEMSLTNSSAKRKMLKLRPNGKLSSPTSKNRAIRRSTDKKVTGNQALPENHRVVILRYGLNSDSRNVIGQKIQPILSDSEERHSCNTEVSAEPLAGPKAVYSGTPKPTHPFFLGKAAAKQASNSNVSSEPIKLSSCSTSSDGSTPSLANTGQAERLPMFGHSSNSSASRDTIRTLRTSGGIEPAWPSKDAMHTRGLETVEDDVFKGYARQVKRQVKMKGSQIRIPRNEDILLLLASKISNQKLRTTVEGDPGRTENPHVLRVPQRKILTGAKLQALTREVVSARLAIPQPASEANPEKHLQSTYKNTHPAVSRHFLELPSSLTAFDQAQCEPYAWVQKYAPKRAEEVLQTGREAIILKDWLRSLTVDAVNAGVGSQINRDSTKRLPRDRAGIHISRRRKRRKRAELLDGFVISSGDEDEEMEELTSPEDANEDDSRGNSLSLKRTVVRIGDTKESLNDLGAISNAVLISGPHGCGKTAAVYATARELGFEVFELNPGSKRSGKDIMEKVGDMTQNHLVQHASDGSDLGDGDGALKDADALSEILTKRQRTLNPFTKSKGTAKSKSSNKPRDPKANLASEQAMKQHAKPKQSLILLEEVDILFDEDKHFWVTVLGLIARSKRPVVMTCNDESLVPLDEMSLYAILRFTPPARDIATDYLLLLAASEGHLLGRSAVQALYESKRLDLRASITELEFWCQMAIGDRKGGLEWMLERCSAANDSDDGGKRMRVVSEDAYLKGMGWLNRDNAISQEIMARDKEIELSVEAWHNWGIWVENWHGHEDASIRNPTIPVSTLESAKASLSDLEDYERLIDATSASDLLGSPGLRMGNLVRQSLSTALHGLTCTGRPRHHPACYYREDA